MFESLMPKFGEGKYFSGGGNSVAFSTGKSSTHPVIVLFSKLSVLDFFLDLPVG
jgi:hypothetical protein